LFKAYLERHRDQIRAADLDLASFVCVTSIEAITHMAVLHNADTFPDEAMNTLVDEATRLIVNYLR
jgi:tetracycline repressor-like protein